MRPATVDLATSSGRTAHDAHDRASGRVPVYASARRHRQLPAPASIGARAASRLPRLATAAATPVHAPAGRPEPYHPPVDAASAAIDPRQAPWRRQKALAAAAFGTAALLAASALPASAAELPLSSTALDVLAGWVQYVETMGPAAPAAVVLTVAVAELVPLLPTTPLAVGAGLLLGAPAGAAAVLAGNLAAATGAFFISRGFGARFARRIIEAEGGGTLSCPASTAPGGLWSRVSAAVGAGSPAEKFAAIAALRATPVIPFSLSSYALGLAPPAGLPYGVYIAGTAAGASIWAGVYASIGAASRAALLASGSNGRGSGAGLEALVAELVDQAASASEGAATVAGVVAGTAALVWAGNAAAGRWGSSGKAEGP